MDDKIFEPTIIAGKTGGSMNEGKVGRPISQEDFVKVCEFLAKEGYLDDDWWCEKPTALEKYLEDKDAE